MARHFILVRKAELEPPPVSHRPDYAKIARLERELGITPPLPQTQPVPKTAPPPQPGPSPYVELGERLEKATKEHPAPKPAAPRRQTQAGFGPDGIWHTGGEWVVDPPPPGEIVGGMEWYMRQQGRPKL